MPLLTTSATTTVIAASDRPPDASWPVTVMGYSPGDASGGTAISRSAVAPVSGFDVIEWITKPPPRSVAFQPSGRPPTSRLTTSGVALTTARLSLTSEPGWASIEGYGVVTTSVASACTDAAVPSDAAA